MSFKENVYRFFDAEDSAELINKAFWKKTNSGKIQFFRYFFVGGFSAVVNLGTLYIFTSLGHVHYLASEVIAFAIATVVNYILSVMWIFERSNKFRLEFMLFTLVGVGGLGINELVLWICVSKLGIYYLLGEAVAIGAVMIWSFSLRKIMFEKLKPKVRT